MNKTGNNKWRFCKVKRILDICGSLILIILFFPISIIICFNIALDSKGSLIHKRKVIGKNNKVFYFLKFRTMYANADEILKSWKKTNNVLYNEYLRNIKLKDDPRVTNFGRFLRTTSMDELPQLFNVLLGDMSLVGPRPISIEEVEKYNKDELTIRLSVKPGITGYWQVNGRQEVSYKDRIRSDVFYIQNQSLKMDIKILLLTIPAVISRRGAH